MMGPFYFACMAVFWAVIGMVNLTSSVAPLEFKIFLVPLNVLLTAGSLFGVHVASQKLRKSS